MVADVRMVYNAVADYIGSHVYCILGIVVDFFFIATMCLIAVFVLATTPSGDESQKLAPAAARTVTDV